MLNDFVSIFEGHANSVSNTNILRIMKGLINDMHFNEDLSTNLVQKHFKSLPIN